VQDGHIERMIGIRIRQNRQHLNLTLEDVAKAAGVSPGLLSKIENGKVSSPISTYLKIAKALGVRLGQLIGDDPEVSCLVVRKEEAKPFSELKSGRGYQFQSLGAHWPSKSLNPFILTYHPPAQDSPSPAFSFDGEEFIYVLEGELEFFHGQERYLLKEGDCVFHNSNVPHGGRAFGGKKAVALLISVPSQ